jgi:pimeloyl-ACP methyl ester carboxylesterase
LLARWLPRWTLLVIGLACVALGAFLIADPFSSLTVLVVLLSASLILTGAGELTAAGTAPRPRLARAGAWVWVFGGIVAAGWPAITIAALAIASGAALLLGGAMKLGGALAHSGEERLLALVGALTSIVVGALALAWPAVTVLVLALIVGLRTLLFGLAIVALLLHRHAGRGTPAPTAGAPRDARGRPGALRWTLAIAALVLALGGMGLSIALHVSSPRRPGPFYASPTPLPPGPPGTLIREEPIPGFYPGTKAYRVLYKSTGFNGHATAVSGVVVVPEGPAPLHGRKIVAFAHGTVGVARNCAPSLQNGGFAQIIEGLGEFIAAGYVVAATDYEGLGTPGPNAYLVGRVEAMDVLDSVRAAHRLREARAGVDFAVWGHSQGGQASLFSGQLAASYAPGLHLVGVAAGAPVPDLIDLFKANLGTTVGKVLVALALSSWSHVYDAASLEQIVTLAARPSVEAIARYCLYGREILASIPSALLLNLSFISSPPWQTEPWKTISRQNSPGATPIGVPVLITQGGADKVVPVAVTQRLAAKLCTQGETVDLRIYPSVEHLEAGIVVAPDVGAWIAGRFAGRPAPSTCPNAPG